MRIAITFILVTSLAAAGCSKKNQPAAAAPKAEPSATEKAPDSAPAPNKSTEDPCAGGEKQPDK